MSLEKESVLKLNAEEMQIEMLEYLKFKISVKNEVSLGAGTQAQDLLRAYSIQKVYRSCKDSSLRSQTLFAKFCTLYYSLILKPIPKNY